MSKVKPISEMHGITDEKSAREYISVIARNIADQSATSAIIAVEWGIDASYIQARLVIENERAQKDLILDAIKFLAFRPVDPTLLRKDEKDEKDEEDEE